MQQLRITLLSCLVVFVLGSCNDDLGVILESNTGVIGSWSLIRTEGSFLGSVTEFQPEEVTLDFSADQVTIASDNSYDLVFFVGIYDYQIESADSGDFLLVGEGVLNGSLELSATQFTIDQRAWDGPLYTFIRN